MEIKYYNKRKILNDPIYGFISIPSELIFDLIEHPYFQRLRRIKQLGLTHLVYPGALHTRFHHAIGAMHLMRLAIDELRLKGHQISNEEAEGVTIAILLHDIGHGPFSHALEHSIVEDVQHEELSLLIMESLNNQFDGRLSLAIQIFKNQYSKKFLHQLVSSQLDMDRLDYLKRDSFFTGVSEGVISTDRIIKMLNIVDDELVVEEKGIYSIEKFIIARRLMYWQVYLHKTVLGAEHLLIKILKRARELAISDQKLFATPTLDKFLQQTVTAENFRKDINVLEEFTRLDDYDIMSSIKVWADSPDKVLADLCSRMVERRLFRVEIQSTKFSPSFIQKIKDKLKRNNSIKSKDLDYYVFTNVIANNAYNPRHDKINLLLKNGKLVDVADAADQLNISALSQVVKKYFLCYPKELI